MSTEQPPLILLLGTDRYAMEACVRHGIDAVVVLGASSYDDGLQRVPEQLTLLLVDDQSSAEAILMALYRAGMGGRRFDAVQTTDEWALVTASLLARELGCDFIDPGTAVHFRDKSLQKARVSAAGIRTAAVTVVEDVHDVSGFTELPYAKAVLKPVAGAATARTSVVESLAQLQERSREYRAQRTAQRTFVLEEYVGAAEEWLADGILFDGELIFCALARYRAPCLTVLDRQLPLSTLRFDPDQDEWAYRIGTPVVRDALSALGLRTGVFHMELFHDPETGEIAFSECAARRGGVLVHEELQAKFNVNIAESAVLCALGRRPELQVKKDGRAIGGAFLMGSPGILVDCPSPAEVAAQPGVLFARIERPFGTRIAAELANTNQRIGQFLYAADSEAELTRGIEQVRTWFEERVVTVPEGATNRQLRAWQRTAYPEADGGDVLWS